MKYKLYVPFIVGVGLAIASTPGYAKPHAVAKKHAHASVQQVKHVIKSAKAAVKHDKKVKTAHVQQVNHNPKNRQHAVLSAHPRAIAAKPSKHHLVLRHKPKHHPMPEYDLEPAVELAEVPDDVPQTVAPSKPTSTLIIPYSPSSNPLVLSDIPSSGNNPRIRTLVPSGASNQLDVPEQAGIHAPSAVPGSGHYSTAHGVIVSSLEAAGRQVGLSDDLMAQLTGIFAWDIDFAENLHRGDQFTVVYELDESGNSQIVAAEFNNQGRIFTAVRFQDSDGTISYYTPEGKAMRKAFLSTPVDYARISSHFDANRRHPILNRIRAHKGVDYAARTGTPVKAAGDGKIAFLGRKGGYGQVIILKHGDRFETLYAHLSNFKSELMEGATVRQGEIIGYVGQTGLATGPHLHYEFRVDGIHQNPEQQPPRHTMALNSELFMTFKNQSQAALTQLYNDKARTLLVRNQYRN
jgi:murein DD-endopeptidase MepM/ murein hydrolase activator NlpD